MADVNVRCNFCKCNYTYVNDWIHHLVERKHQIVSRQAAAFSNFGGTSWKPLIIVATATANLRFAPDVVSNGLQLLFHFARGYEAVVEDFVWSSKRPKTALLKFSNTTMVEKVMDKCSIIKIETNNVTLQRASALSNDQWNGLMDAVLSSTVSPSDILSLR